MPNQRLLIAKLSNIPTKKARQVAELFILGSKITCNYWPALSNGDLFIDLTFKGLTIGIFQLILFITFSVITTLSDQKNNRNLMLLGAIAISFAFVGLDFLLGVDEGLSDIN